MEGLPESKFMMDGGLVSEAVGAPEGWMDGANETGGGEMI